MNEQKTARPYVKYIMITVLYISGPAFIALTDPSSLPLPLLVIPFIWLFVCLFVAAWYILGHFRRISRRQAGLIAGVVASIPVLLVVFQSIRQLSLADVLLAFSLVIVAAVYMSRADFIK